MPGFVRYWVRVYCRHKVIWYLRLWFDGGRTYRKYNFIADTGICGLAQGLANF